ncbi:MAG: hypothetical protein GXP47_01760 [Acidobacteria bacterium]|nr:hypothetical protein [Acidobacteriota bacterium]
MNISTLLSRLEALEHSMADLYLWLAGRFGDDDEAAGLFMRLHMQELSHANLVHFERRLARSDPDSFPDVDVDTSSIDEVLRWNADFRSNGGPGTLGQALLFAMKVESHAAEQLHRKAVTASNPDLEGLVASLAQADREHFETLKRYVRANAHLLA